MAIVRGKVRWIGLAIVLGVLVTHSVERARPQADAWVPPVQSSESWVREAEAETPLWHSSLAWCQQRSGDTRCGPVAVAVARLLRSEMALREPAEVLSLVPAGVVDTAPRRSEPETDVR